MYREKVRATHCSEGFYREAVGIVRKANEFSSDIYIEKDNKSANAKSVLGVIALMIHQGDTLTLSAEGPDAGVALKQLCCLIGESTNLRNEY